MEIKMSIRVLIADDHAMIREGIKQLLELDGTVEVIGEASDGYECLNLTGKLKPEILLLDINMPGMDGIQALTAIRQKKMKTKVIILTIHNDIEYLIRALDIGCDGYVLKNSDSTTLKKAIMSVHEGEGFVEPSLTPQLNSRLARRDMKADKVKELTKREIEVLKLIAHGKLNRDIALALDISERTVKNHISHIFNKISVSDRTQAAVFAIKNKIVDIQ